MASITKKATRFAAKVGDVIPKAAGLSESNFFRPLGNVADGGAITLRNTGLNTGGLGDLDHKQAKDAAEAARLAAQNEPVMPVPDDYALARARRRGEQSRRNRGRASTILGNDAETLG